MIYFYWFMAGFLASDFVTNLIERKPVMVIVTAIGMACYIILAIKEHEERNRE